MEREEVEAGAPGSFAWGISLLGGGNLRTMGGGSYYHDGSLTGTSPALLCGEKEGS